jgi:hypothetical protein
LSALNGNSDPLVVQSEEFRELIKQEFNNDATWVYQVAKILNIDARNVYRKLFLQKTVSYGIADEWLTRLDMPGQVQHLEAIPNPRWTQEKWINYMKERGCI